MKTGRPSTIWDRLESHFQALSEKQDRPEMDLEALRKRLESRAKALRGAARTEAPARRIDALFFKIGSELYALRLRDIQAVHALTHFTPVPGVPPYLRGVAHLHGDFLSLLDIGLFLGMERKGLADLRRVVVIGGPPMRLAVLAGEVEDIFSVSEESVSSAPDQAGRPRGACVEGVIGGDRLLLSAGDILEQAGSG
ncbi:chemotaxis protein CheW [bacterium]|nr:chemotaxis protein CheW [bacterium]